MTTAPKPARKHTAANTPALARVKKLFNPLIYKGTLDAYNAGGEAEAREYVGQFYNDECRAERVADLFRD